MNDFVNNVLSELQNNQNIKDNGLVKLVVESANKSIANSESSDVVYSELKRSISAINEQINSADLDNIISQFEKIEDTSESRLAKLAKLGNLSGKIFAIKESTAYSNPIIADKVNKYEANLESVRSEFTLYPAFINDFKSHMIEESVKIAVSSIEAIMEKNASKFEVLFAINQMEGMNAKLYSGIKEGLEEMLVSESFTSDIINLKYGSTNLPIVNALVNSLKVLESRNAGTFSMGAGNSDTNVRNVICPAIKSAKKSVMTYIDGRFIRLTESEKLNGSEVEVNAKSQGFSISTIDPEWVKKKHTSFYNVCEAYARLGFKASDNFAGVESNAVSKFNIGLSVNENRDLDLYINGNKVDNAKEVNLSEALVMVDEKTKGMIKTVLENTSMILNLEFIKNVRNDRTLSESFVFNLGPNYFLCDILNEAERNWTTANEYKMYEHFISKFNYDISPIFGTKINEAAAKIKAVEARKAEIVENIKKLEESVAKLSQTSESKDIDPSNIAKLDELKNSINDSISMLKEEYIKLDLSEKARPDYPDVDGDGDKKESMKDALEDKKNKYCQKHFKCDYKDCNKEQKKECDENC
jgi:hypothetical protein